MTNNLAVFAPLKSEITNFVGPSMTRVVSNFDTANEAVDALKTIKRLQKDIEAKRKSLTDPLEAEKKAIIAYARDIADPLDKAEIHVKRQLAAFEDEQAKIRAAAQKKIDDERRARDEEERVKAEKAVADLEAQASADAEAAELFGSDGEPTESAEDKKSALLAQIEIDKKVRAAEHQAKTFDVNQQGVKNARRIWKCDLLDINLVPMEFINKSLNSAAALTAARAADARGETPSIPGLRIYQETSIAVGANTYIPRENLVR